MEIAAVLGFVAIAFTLLIVPGPDWAFILAAGVRDRVVVPAVGGLLGGYVIITIAVVLGIGPLVAAAPAALTILTVAGAAYLLWLGVRTLRASGEATVQADGAIAASPLGYVTRGVAVSALNPKGLLLFLSILPQFTSPGTGWPLTAQLAALGGLYVLATAIVYFPLGFLAGRVLGSRPGVAQLTTRIAGIAMIVVALVLLAEKVIPLF